MAGQYSLYQPQQTGLDSYRLNTPQAPVPQSAGFSDYLSSGTQGAAQGAAASGGNPYVAAGMAAISLLNTALGSDKADEQYKLQKQQYEDQLGLNREARLQTQKNQELQNLYAQGNNASAAQTDIRNPFADYNKMIGR